MRGALTLVVAALVAACGGGAGRLVLAAGTTTVDSGLVPALVAEYLAGAPGPRISIVGLPTRQVLALGEAGEAGLLITHEPDLEEAFLAAHPDALAAPAFSSRFVLVGPPDQTIVVAGTPIDEALRRIAVAGAAFVTRNDGSGTHAKERELWNLAGVEPDGEPWYMATGQGMGFTLQVADQRGAFTLAEEGAFVASADGLDLVVVPVTAPDGLLENPYRIIAVDGDDPAAVGFVTWLTSAVGRAALRDADLRLFGREVYRPPA